MGTTLSLEFVKKYSTQIIHINQDELGKKVCEEVFIEKSKSSNTIILDRCNISKKEREEWIKCANDKNIIAIYFYIGVDECIKRVSKRKNLPSLSGEAGSKIIQNTYKKIEKPDKLEGFKNIYEIKSDEDLIFIKKTFNLTNEKQEIQVVQQVINKNIIDYDHIISKNKTFN